MRLLRVNDGSLVERHGKDIPPYVILSHTWSSDEEEEYIFSDAKANSGKNKPGYLKVQFCIEQAQKDEIDYVWIDTCCIDKNSSAELSETINSMFRWYQDAVKCYVWLSDVSILSEESSGCDHYRPPSQKPSLKHSRWFTRSWTLQELLAPASVEFFSNKGKFLGRKDQLHFEIHRITGIPVTVLQDSSLPLSGFSINERMSWAHNRQAKRDEDHEYALLGLFDISMPLLYGEGRKKARARLEREILYMENHGGSESIGNQFQDTHRQNGGFPSPHISSQGWNRGNQNVCGEGSGAKRKKQKARKKRSGAEPQHQQPHRRSHEIKDDLQSNYPFINATQGTIQEFRAHTQNNNTGSGPQFIGNNTNGTFHFG